MISLQPQWLGNIDYIAGVRAVESEGKDFAARHALELPIANHTIFGMEHPLTITLGKRADPLKDICASIVVLRSRGVQIVGSDRGGQATLHNSGQLVIYPHLHLPTWGVGVREFVGRLQRATQLLVGEFGVEASTDEAEPGVYVGGAKIAFFGLRIKNGWVSHGLALNVHNDLQDFALIRSCGRINQKVTRLADLTNLNLGLPEVFERWCAHFVKVMADKPQTSPLTSEIGSPMLDNSGWRFSQT